MSASGTFIVNNQLVSKNNVGNGHHDEGGLTSRKLARSILPSSVNNTCNEILSLKYHTVC